MHARDDGRRAERGRRPAGQDSFVDSVAPGTKRGVLLSMPNLLERVTRESLSELRWLNEPDSWSIDPSDGSITIVPNAATDFFRPLDDLDAPANDNCCLLFTEVTGDFTATTHTKATLCDFGDAAALTLRVHESLWAKLCLERSPIGDISLVSVVTNPFSDDANSEVCRLMQLTCSLARDCFRPTQNKVLQPCVLTLLLIAVGMLRLFISLRSY